MGCCASTPSPYPSHQPSSSSRAITHSQPQSQAALPRPSTAVSRRSAIAGPSSNNRHQNPRDLATHINHSLRPHVWTSVSRTWNRQQLDRERIDFFDTRVTGRPEIWQTIHAALQILWQGGDAMDDGDGGLGTAQMILTAADITLNRGDLCAGVYDRFGESYQLPEHIVADPTNIVDTPEEELEGRKSESEPSEPSEDEMLRRREERGKTVLRQEDMVAIRFKLSDRDSLPFKVTIGKKDTVRLICRRIIEEMDIPSAKRLKLAYLGKILREKEGLFAQGFDINHVVNVLVFNQEESVSTSGSGSGS